ncbi:MAG: hypothetical protein ACI9FJ_002780 [Alteromonadaceae bacterium]|jgi:hypothetical protein
MAVKSNSFQFANRPPRPSYPEAQGFLVASIDDTVVVIKMSGREFCLDTLITQALEHWPPKNCSK